jgi:hypothetical protein
VQHACATEVHSPPLCHFPLVHAALHRLDSRRLPHWTWRASCSRVTGTSPGGGAAPAALCGATTPSLAVPDGSTPSFSHSRPLAGPVSTLHTAGATATVRGGDGSAGGATVPKVRARTHFLGRGVPDQKQRVGAPRVVFFPQLSPTLCADNVHIGGCCTRGAATQRLGRRSPDGCSRRLVFSVERDGRVAPCSGTHRRGVLPSIRRPQLLLQRRRRAHCPSTSTGWWPRTLCSRHLARCAPTLPCLPVASCMRVMTPECSMQPR